LSVKSCHVFNTSNVLLLFSASCSDILEGNVIEPGVGIPEVKLGQTVQTVKTSLGIGELKEVTGGFSGKFIDRTPIIDSNKIVCNN